MKKAEIVVLGLVWFAGLSAKAMEKPKPEIQAQSAASDDKTTPSYDMKAQALVDLQDLQKKYVQWAKSIPADKYTWRPEPGVRSVSELFLHVASANYGIPTMMTGTSPAPGFQKEGFESPPRTKRRSSSN